MSVTSAFDPGTEIAGFRIEGVLGRGGMGTVYRAAHPRLQQSVALKVINAELAEDEDFRERFIREAQLASGINHPNIIPVYDADDGHGRLYLAMRLVEGPGLDEILAREAPLDAGRTLALLAQVASALDVSHIHGLVHRDVKPENILTAPGGATEYGEHVYLSDFGISKKVGASGPTRTGQLVGTLHYLAPELIDGKPIDGRCDEYALGCVLHRCLTGVLPFERDSDAQLLMAHLRDAPPKVSASRPDLPGRLDEVLARMLAKDPDDRYDTCGHAISDARSAVTGGARSPARRKPRALAPRASRRTRRLVLAGGLAVLFVAAAIGAAAVISSRDGGGADQTGVVKPPGTSIEQSVGSAKPLQVANLRLGSPDRYVAPATRATGGGTAGGGTGGSGGGTGGGGSGGGGGGGIPDPP